MASLCGLPTVATVDEVIEVVASTTGRPRAAVRALLLDDIPTSDVRLVRMTDELQRLEDDLTRSVIPS